MLMSQGMIAACLLVTSVLGCANWQRVTDLSPRAYVEQHEPSEARLTFTDSTQVVLYNLWVTEGSIGSNRERRESSRKLAFPLASVVSSASPDLDEVGSLAAVTLELAGTVALVYGIFAARYLAGACTVE
jgi:hypothetical protein